jgi:hypothetical protein
MTRSRRRGTPTEVVAGAVEVSIGVAKREAAREISRGADALATFAKKAARSLER